MKPPKGGAGLSALDVKLADEFAHTKGETEDTSSREGMQPGTGPPTSSTADPPGAHRVRHRTDLEAREEVEFSKETRYFSNSEFCSVGISSSFTFCTAVNRSEMSNEKTKKRREILGTQERRNGKETTRSLGRQAIYHPKTSTDLETKTEKGTQQPVFT